MVRRVRSGAAGGGRHARGAEGPGGGNAAERGAQPVVNRIMASRALVLSGVCCAALLVGACGEPPDSRSAARRLVGAAPEEAPLPRPVHDPGILQDPTTYQPAKGGGLGPGALRGQPAATPGELGGDARAQVASTFNDLRTLIRDGEVKLVLGLFDAEHVAALGPAQSDALYTTFERIDRLARSLREKVGEGKTEQILAVLWGAAGEVEPRVIDADHAAVQPNVARILFGPGKVTPTLVFVRQEGRWRAQLDSPLTADDAAAIVAFHAQLQVALGEITDWVEAAAEVDEARLREALEKALAGQETGLGAAAPAEPGAEPEGRPSGPPPEPTGRGRIRPPG